MLAATWRVAIFGATSDIAVAYSRRLAASGAQLVLVGRDQAALQSTADDLKVRGAANVDLQTADFANLDALAAICESAWNAFGGLDVALVAYGSLPDQSRIERDVAAAAEALAVNFVSPCLLCDCLGTLFEAQREGTIAVITSVAGDRGRKSNYIYGAAKGGLQRYLEGLRHRLYHAGVQVLDIRPGFVSTKMTAHLTQGGLLWTSPTKIAADIDRAVAGGREVLYTPWFWRYIMTIIRWLPRPIFHRTSF